MTPADAAFLTALKMNASGEHLRMLREDALRLLVLAGFGQETWPYQEMAARGDVVLVDPIGVRAAVAWALGEQPAA